MEMVAHTIVDQVEPIPVVAVDTTVEVVSTITMDTIPAVDIIAVVDTITQELLQVT